MSDLCASIIITAYKPRPFIVDAMESVVKQDASNYEVILVTNYVDQWLMDYAHEKQIKIIHSEHSSQGSKIIEGFNASKGEIILLLEDDDLFSPSKVSEVVKTFEGNKDLYFYNNTSIFIDDTGTEIQPPHGLRKRIDNIERIKSFCLKRTITDTGKKWDKVGLTGNLSAISVRKELIKENRETINESPLGMDVILYLLAVLSNRCVLIDNRRLSSFRFHDKNSSLDSNVDEEIRLDYLQHMLSVTLEANRIALDIAKLTGIRCLIRPRANFYYLSLIIYETFKGNMSRGRTMGALLHYIGESPLRMLLIRPDVLFYAIVHVIFPAWAKLAFLKRHGH